MRNLEHVLGEYHDDELPAGKRRRVEAHLRECPDSQAELRQMERLSEVLARDKLPETWTAAETFRSQVMLRLSRRQASQARYTSWVWYAVPVALLCAVLALQGLFVLSGSLIWATDIIRWAGVDLSADAWLLGALDTDLTLENTTLSPVISLVGDSVRQVLFYVLLLVVFVPYVGWIGALWRSGTHPSSLEGEIDGSL